MGGHRAVIEIVVEPRGTGSRALAALPVGARVAVTGPLGRPFALPRDPARCLLVGEGYAAGALTTLAERLRERGCGVRLVLGGADDAHVLEPLAARRSVGQVEVAVGDLTAPVLRSLEETDVVYVAASEQTHRFVAGAVAGMDVTCQARARAAADLRHRSVPRVPGARAGRRRCTPRRPRLRRRAGVPGEPGRLGGAWHDRLALHQPCPDRVRVRRHRPRARGVRRPRRARRLRDPVGDPGGAARRRPHPGSSSRRAAWSTRSGYRTPASRRSSVTSYRRSSTAGRRSSRASPGTRWGSTPSCRAPSAAPGVTAVEVNLSAPERRGKRRCRRPGAVPGRQRGRLLSP